MKDESTERRDDVDDLAEVRADVVAIFEDAARMLGLPKSVGGIYGLLFVSSEGLSLDDVVTRLNVSKGSASQGLRLLRTLGAVRPVARDGERREFFVAEVELKQLVAGFIRSELEPQIDRGSERSELVRERFAELKLAASSSDDEEFEHLEERVERLSRWHRRAKFVLPFIARFLG